MTVQSVRGQTYGHWELLIVDDGSTDGTAEVLEGLQNRLQDPRITLLRQANQGAAAARNRGLARAQGEYIAFIDSDDLWLPGKLAADVATLRRCGVAECIVYGWYSAVDEARRLLHQSPRHREAGDIFHTVMTQESVLLPSTMLIHRRVAEVIGGFPANHPFHEDRTFSLKAAQRFPAYPTGERQVLYRQSESGKCRRVLADFDRAVLAKQTVVESMADCLTPEALATLDAVETRNLFYRFLMYNRLEAARRLYPQVPPALLRGSKKGLLARWSLATGVNLLYPLRRIIQGTTRRVTWPWWRRKIACLETEPSPLEPSPPAGRGQGEGSVMDEGHALDESPHVSV